MLKLAQMNWPSKGATSISALSNQDLLQSIQCNILQGHGRDFARLVFFTLPSDAALRSIFLRTAASRWVNSAWDQFQQSRDFRLRTTNPKAEALASPTVLCSLALVGEVFRKLRPGLQTTVDSPEALGSWRTSLENLRPNATKAWSAPYTNSFDGVWMLACDDTETLGRHSGRLRDWITAQGGAILDQEERGGRWRNADGQNREPFGFEDGISTPIFLEESRSSRPSPWVDMTLDEVLVLPHTPGADPRHLGGSFLVLLKLEQDVRAFREYEVRIAALLRAHGVADAGEIAPALLMGRLRDGRPLIQVLNPSAIASDRNQFDFEEDLLNQGCPFHAHIRKMNPRVEASAGLNREFVVRNQVVRRSLIYPDRSALDAAERGEAKWPSEGVGILFMAYMTSIVTQFETLHNSWSIDGDFPPPNPLPGQVPQADPILWGGTGGSWSWRGIELPPVPTFVKRLGGQYFFVPSLAWLAQQ